jgi:glycosyltransferase involved in cell wall biosynthesis
MKIGIAHRNIVSRDAVGNDILGMREVLNESGFAVQLIGEYFDDETRRRAETVLLGDCAAGADLGALIYHHSIFWPGGEALLRRSAVPCLLKYHNVTPSRFFAAYSTHLAAQCAEGRAQTPRLASLCGARGAFAAASSYSAAELTEAGATGPVAIAPPFIRIDRVTCREPPPRPPYRVLFVGRVAPNKGHLQLLTVISAYVALFGPDVELKVAGPCEPDLAN